jgi:hypothetical protein
MRTVINGQDVYLDGDNIPEFSYSLNELTDFTKVKGSSSTTFDIPASNAARVGLGGVAMQEQPIGEVPIRIGEGGQVLFEGVCVPTEWTDESIKVVAYGDNATWFDRAKSTKCVDVDLGITETMTANAVAQQWATDALSSNFQNTLQARKYFFPLIDYGSMEAYTGTTNITLDKIRWAVSLRALLKKFFNDAGFTVIVKGKLNTLWNRLMLPSSSHTYRPRPYKRIVSASVDANILWAELAPAAPIGSYGMDTVIVEGEYPFAPTPAPTPPFTGLSTIRSAINAVLTINVNGTYRIYRGSSGGIGTKLNFQLMQLTGYQFPNYIIIAQVSIDVPPGEGAVDVEIDQELFSTTIQSGIDYTLVVTPDPVTGSILDAPAGRRPVVEVIAGTEISFELTPPTYTEITTGFEYHISSAIAPSLTVADVISSLATMLRLVITTNQLSNEVTFQHYDDYLLDPSEGVDWRDRLSHNTLPAKVRPETPERFVFKYADDDKDERLFNYNDETNWTAEGVYDTDGRDEEKVSTLKFAATQQGVRFNNAVVPVIKEVDKVTDYVKCKPRIMVHGGFQFGGGTAATRIITYNGQWFNYCPRFYFSGSGGNDINIGFGNDAGRLGTLERFWRASLIRAVKPYLKGEFRVYDDEFMNFEFARPRLVNDGYGNVWMYVQVVKGKKFGDDDLVDCELIPV